MKTTGSQALLNTTAAALLCLTSGTLWAGTEGSSSTFYGVGAGASGAGTIGQNTFVGLNAGSSTSSGGANTFVGANAGLSNSSGYSNTLVGWNAGRNNTAGQNVFLGYNAGYWNTTGSNNVFLGTATGQNNTIGYSNTFLGNYAGYSNTTGYLNTAFGYNAGYSNSTGARNVFLGYGAGQSEGGSDKLYIDNCYSGFSCTSPLIYGEFNNHLLKFNAAVDVTANGAAKSQLHFSQNGTDVGGWLTSVSDNNFFMSSGAKYDAAAGGWIQKSSDGKAMMAGSGASGYRIFTSQGAGVGAILAPTSRLHIDYSGNLGLNTPAVAGQPITTGTGAMLSAGGAWLNASSRERKENIQELSAADAQQTLAMLSPVSFNYKVDGQEKHVGFIAEDVPEMVASKDRKSLSALDIVAVLTRVVQEQRQSLETQRLSIETQKQAIEEQKRAAQEQKLAFEKQEERLSQLAAEVRRLRAPSVTARR